MIEVLKKKIIPVYSASGSINKNRFFVKLLTLSTKLNNATLLWIMEEDNLDAIYLVLPIALKNNGWFSHIYIS